ncbi:MAG: hypothetical protein HC830_14080 [Bacteroidetes bacterium]|nr:hypothetical protein [Bacteroidota bacterium]
MSLLGCSNHLCQGKDEVIKKSNYYVLDMVHHNPGEERTVTAFNSPEKLASYGYTGKILNDFKFAHCAITYGSLNPNIFPAGSKERQWVNEVAGYVQNEIKQCHKNNIDIYCFLDVIVIPKKLKELYADSLCNAEGKIDFSKPFTREVHRIMIDEVFKKFPDLDGLVIRTGETYLHSVPYHTGNNPILSRDTAELVSTHIELINLLREEVCVKRDKKLFYRTWDFGFFHTEPEIYLNITNHVKPHQNLIFSIKHTDGDYHRTLPLIQR